MAAADRDVRSRIADGYRRFSRFGARGRSPVYEAITEAVAGDEVILGRLTALPDSKHQPNLLLGAVRYLYGTPENPDDFLAVVHERWPDIEDVIRERVTQTNEPARCSTLLPSLAELPPPLALIEVGASAGLCLKPDRYVYAYDGRRIWPRAPTVSQPPVFECSASARTPVPERNLEVVWRAGLDRRPVDLSNEDEVRWLEALVWPGEEYRIPLLRAAIEVARAHPTRIVKGDLRADLKRLAAEAPRDATLVVYHTAVLAYVQSAEERADFARTLKDLGAVWVANEGAENLPGIGNEVFGGPVRADAFLQCVNGRPVAWVDSHGTWIDWHAAG